MIVCFEIHEEREIGWNKYQDWVGGTIERQVTEDVSPWAHVLGAHAENEKISPRAVGNAHRVVRIWVFIEPQFIPGVIDLSRRSSQ